MLKFFLRISSMIFFPLRSLLRYLLPSVFLFLFLLSQDSEFVPLSEIKPGDILTAKTRIEHNVMHHFPVKVISIVKNSGSAYATIIAESDDPVLLETRVASGMSGSPVYVGDRLVGAIAYAWGFLEKPLMGITPIGDMLPIIDYQGKESPDVYGVGMEENGGGSPGENQGWYDLRELDQVGPEYFEFLQKQGRAGASLSRKIGEIKSTLAAQSYRKEGREEEVSENFVGNKGDGGNQFSVPISMSWSGPWGLGGSPRSYQFYGQGEQRGQKTLQEQMFPGMRVMPVIAVPMSAGSTSLSGSATSTTLGGGDGSADTGGLEPGDYIGINLVRGDIEFNIFGTVTYIKGDTLLAFGHHMGRRGAIRLPLYKARTETIVPLQNISFKMGSLVREMGTVEQDRNSGILGKIGGKATYFPVEITLDTLLRKESYRFEVADDKQFSGFLTAFSVGEIYAWAESSSKPVALDYSLVFDYTTASGPDTATFSRYGNFLNSREGINTIIFDLMQLMSLFRDNPLGAGVVKGVKVKITSRPGYDSMQAVVIRQSQTVYRPGEEIRFQVGFDRYRKPRTYREFTYRIPDNAHDGVYNLAISSARLRWLAEYIALPQPQTLKGMVDLLTSLPPSNRLSVWKLADEENLLIKDKIYHRLPANQRKLLLGSLHNEKNSALEVEYQDHDLETSPEGFLTLTYRVDRNHKK